MNLQLVPLGRIRLIRTTIIATSLWLGMSQSTWASIVTRAVNVTLNAANIESYDLDVNLDGTTDFTFSAALVLNPVLSVGFDVVNFRFGSSNGVVIDVPTGDGFPAASLLQAGNTVSAANTFSGPNDQGNLFSFTSFDLPSGNFGGQTGYLGFRFDTAGGTNYGYAQVTVNGRNAQNNPLGLTIGTIAYNDAPGERIQIVAVPEPTGLALFGIGLLGVLVAFKRSRRAASEA